MNSETIKSFFKRILSSIIVLFLLLTFIFFLVRLAPGDPTQKFISPKLNPELAEQVYKSFGLDQPLYVQYISYLSNAFTGNLGMSYTYRQPVLSVVGSYFLFTLLFASLSFILQLIFGYYLSKAAFKNRGKLLDKILSKLFLFIYSVPSFVIGVVLIYLFSINLNIFPTSGLKSVYSEENSLWYLMLDYSLHLVLPLITISLGGIAIVFKYLKENLISLSKSSFITNLRALGFKEKVIFNKHLVPNALHPLISIAGIEFGSLLSGALITEIIFSLPGMGRLTVNAILNKDFPLVIGCSLVAGLMMIVSNFIADIVKIKLDKRLTKHLIN